MGKELLFAWHHVQAKSAAPGLDGIDIADFSADADRQLKELADAMVSGEYTPLPVRIFTIRKLAVLYDRLKVDRFEIGIGTLVRERRENGEFGWRVDIL